MEYLKAFLLGITFIGGMLTAVIIAATFLRAKSAKDAEWMRAYNLRVEKLLSDRNRQSSRIADVLEWYREKHDR